MGLTTASARQRIEFLDAKHIAIDAQLVALVPDLKQHVGRPACILTSSRKARLAVLLGTETVATIEVDTVATDAWTTRNPTLGNRSAGFIDMDIFLQQHARPLQKHGAESPAISAERVEEPSPAKETAAPSPAEELFSVSKAEKRKLARVQAAREQSETAALQLKKKEEEDATATKTQAAVTIQRVFGVALRARAQSPPLCADAAQSETFRKQLDDLELESIFEKLEFAGVTNMGMLKKMDMPTVLTVCGLHKADSGMRPRLTRAQEAALEQLTAKTPTAPARVSRPSALLASATPKPTSAKRPVVPPAAPAAARPTAYLSMVSKLEEYATSSAEFTKFLKQAVDLAEPPNRTEIKRSKDKMVKTVEDFIRSFITSINDIPIRKPASLDAEQLVEIVITIVEVNGGHASDEEGAAPLVLADTIDKRDGFASFLKENGLEDKLQLLIDGGIETHSALRRFTPAELAKKCKLDLSRWESYELRALHTLCFKEASGVSTAPRPIVPSALRLGGDVRPSLSQALGVHIASGRFKMLPLVDTAMKAVPVDDADSCIATWLNTIGRSASRVLGDVYELPALGTADDNAENLEVLLELLVKSSVIQINDLKGAAFGEDDGLQSARLRARRLAIELSPPEKPASSMPDAVPLIDLKQQTLTRELMAAAGKAPETSAEKAAGEKRLIDVALDASLSASVVGLHALETAGKLSLADFKKAASAVQVAELLKQSKIGLPTGASSALRTLWEAYGAVQRGIKREVARELEKLMPEGADCEALAAAVFDGNLHALDLQKVVSSKATKTVLGSTSPKSKTAAAKADAADAASESYAHCITGLEFALEVLNPNDSNVVATMRLVRAEVEALHRSGYNRGDAANKLLSALLTEYDHDHEEYRRGRAQPLLSTAWETALKTNKISKLISSAGGESVKVVALEALLNEQAEKLKTAAAEAHKAATKVETMNKRLTELEQLCSKRWKETKANFISDESGSESSRPATPNGGRGGGTKAKLTHPSKGAGAPAPAPAPAAQ